jgi:hypothetical protein
VGHRASVPAKQPAYFRELAAADDTQEIHRKLASPGSLGGAAGAANKQFCRNPGGLGNQLRNPRSLAVCSDPP